MVAALILAASRRGPEDPVARLQGESHKCLVRIGGTPMIVHVVAALRATTGIGRIFISIENVAELHRIPALAPLLAANEVVVISSRSNLAASVLAAIPEIAKTDGAAFPLLITTADNALHTPAMVGQFCADSLALACDATVGMTSAATVLARYPEGQRAFHHFRDGPYSGCNIYFLNTPRAADAARAFAGGGQFGKKPWRLIAAFGFGTFLRYMLRQLTLDEAMAQVSRALAIEVRAVLMPYAEAPIDIDTPADYRLAEEVLGRSKSND